MTTKAFYLTEADARVLREIVYERRNNVINTHNRPNVPPRIPQAPEVYIARTPAGGIAAYAETAGTGTGSVELRDSVPHGNCDIFRITPSGSVFYLELVGLTKQVFNLSLSPILEGRWTLVIRDKFGSWLIAGGTPLADCASIVVQETDFRCENGVLNLYRRNVAIAFGDDGCLDSTNGDWRFIRALVASCIEEDTDTGTGFIETGTDAVNPGYRITAILDFPVGSPFPDHDLYGSNDTDGAVCYFGALSAGGLVLNHDVYPVCATNPDPPEIITGEFFAYKSFRFWRNQYSNCAPPQTVTIESISVTNIGTGAFKVNGATVAVGDTYTVSTNPAYPGILELAYASGVQSTYPGPGTPVVVTAP